MLVVFASSFLCVWNQMPWINLQTIVLPPVFFANSPSIIRRIIRMFDVLDRFLRKSFWFFQRIFLTSSRIRLWTSKDYTFVIRSDSKVAFLREKEVQIFIHFSITFFNTEFRIFVEVCRQIFFSSILQEVFRWGLQFSAFKFFQDCLKSFFLKLSSFMSCFMSCFQ